MKILKRYLNVTLKRYPVLVVTFYGGGIYTPPKRYPTPLPEMSMPETTNEEHMQILLVNWLHRTYPGAWEATHHSPNGGHRNKATGARMKLMGTRRGFPDLVTFLPKHGFAGLVVELKWGRGQTSDEQNDWLERLGKGGYQTHVVNDLEKAKEIYREYLSEATR